jgi:asparagine synthase (glutamine-hydrolysing)
MLLSGGLDSRALLALLQDETDLSRFPTFTWGIPNCDDARFSREVARKLGTEHRFFELKPDWLLHHAAECVRATDGMGNIVNLHARATLDQEAEYAQVLYKGFLGDAMMGFAQRHQHWADYDSETAIQAHLNVHRSQGVVTFGPEDHRDLFTLEMQREIGDAVMDEYRAGMAASCSRQLADQRIYYDYCQRVPRHTLNGVQVVRSRAVVRLPFADNDLVDLMLQVPPGMRFQRRIMRNAFIRDFPDLARIPLPDTGLPMLDCARDIWIRSQRWMRWHLGKTGLMRKNYLGRRPYKDYATWFRTDLRDWVESVLLDSRSLQRGYFQPSFVRNVVQEHMAGKDHSIRLGAFMTVELWHRQFID